MTQKNNWAPRPPMGWNSWDCYGTSVDEKTVRGNAEYMAEQLKGHGWEYVVVDIQWSQSHPDGWAYRPFTDLCMDEYSRLIPAENRFPSSAGGKGFKPLSDYIHSLGLKFGIHIMRGIPRQAVHRRMAIDYPGATALDAAQTFSVCPWNTDMYGVSDTSAGQAYYDSIFRLYADWGVDYVKVDDIANTEFKPHDPYSAKREIEMIRAAIDKTGRAIVLSLSPGPAPIAAAEHLCANANLWRMTGDFWDSWPQLKAEFKRCEQWAPYVKKGCWPDCDMLPLGIVMAGAMDGGHPSGFTKTEQVTLMNLFCIFRSPLMMGGEMRRNDEFTLNLMTNEDALKVNREGTAPTQLFLTEDAAAWKNTCEDGTNYLALFNLSDVQQTVTVDRAEAGFGDSPVTEVWSKITAPYRGSYTIPPHGSLMFRNLIQSNGTSEK